MAPRSLTTDETDWGVRELAVRPISEWLTFWPPQARIPPPTTLDGSTVDPRPDTIQRVWVSADDRSLRLEGFYGVPDHLHSVHVEEHGDRVMLTAMVGETAEWRKSVEQLRTVGREIVVHTVGVPWQFDVVLQEPLAGRPVYDTAEPRRL
jgi:hypothetical protein